MSIYAIHKRVFSIDAPHVKLDKEKTGKQVAVFTDKDNADKELIKEEILSFKKMTYSYITDILFYAGDEMEDVFEEAKEFIDKYYPESINLAGGYAVPGDMPDEHALTLLNILRASYNAIIEYPDIETAEGNKNGTELNDWDYVQY